MVLLSVCFFFFFVLWKLNFKISIFDALIFDLWPSYLSSLEWRSAFPTCMLFRCEMGLWWSFFFTVYIYLSRLRLWGFYFPKGYIYNNRVSLPASGHFSITLTQVFVISRMSVLPISGRPQMLASWMPEVYVLCPQKMERPEIRGENANSKARHDLVWSFCQPGDMV